MAVIKVTGKGIVAAVCNRVELTLCIKQSAQTVDGAVSGADKRIKALKAALVANQLDEKLLKTGAFSVSAKYESIHEGGAYRQKFIGYCCREELSFALDYTAEGLSRAVSALAGADELNLHFTVREKEEMRARALRAAYDTACAEATVLAEASGKTLGELVELSCGNQEDTLPVLRMAKAEVFALQNAAVELNPADVTVHACVSAIWNLR